MTRPFLLISFFCGILLFITACGHAPNEKPLIQANSAHSVQPGALQCDPQSGWKMGIGLINLESSCMASSDPLFTQAYRLGSETKAIQTALEQDQLSGPEKSRLMEELTTLKGIAVMRGWTENNRQPGLSAEQ